MNIKLLDKVCTNIPNLEMDAEGNVIEKGPETKIPEADAEIDDETVDVKAELEPEVIDTSLQQIDDLIGDAADTPPDETETEPFDFAKPIDPDEIILDGFQEDQDKLAELQSKLREERAKKTPRHAREKRRQEVTGQEGARDEETSYYTIPHTDKRSFRIHGSRGHSTLSLIHI